MAVIDEQELKAQLKNDNLSNVYFIYGEETLLKKKYCDKLVKRLVGKESGDYSFQKFEGDEMDFDSFGGAVEAFPMMSDKKCLLVQDLDAYALNQSDFDKVIDIISDVPEYCYVIFILAGISPDLKNAKWKKLINTVSKVGSSIEFKNLDRASAVKALCSKAEKLGCTLEKNLAGYIIEVAGTDMQNLGNELEKICAYCGEGAINREHIDSVICKSVDAKGYELAKAIIKNDFSKAFDILNNLFYLKIKAPVILAAITGNYIDIYRAKCAVSGGVDMSTLSKAFLSYKGKEFKLKYAASDARSMSIQRLRQSISVLYEADLRIKSSRTDEKIIIEEMISKLLLIAAKEAKRY